jgi:hypothetical protein
MAFPQVFWRLFRGLGKPLRCVYRRYFQRAVLMPLEVKLFALSATRKNSPDVVDTEHAYSDEYPLARPLPLTVAYSPNGLKPRARKLGINAEALDNRL